MMNDDERNLQQRFEAWSAQEQNATPDFDRVWRRAERAAVKAESPREVARLWPRFTMAALAVVLATAIIWWGARDGGDASWDAQLAAFESELAALPADAEPAPPAWTAPTDFLLAAIPDETLNALNR
jgi:hypothetical protein